MKALVKAKPEPGIWLQDVPVPDIGANDVLIKIYKTAICGTDVHIYNWDAWAQKTIPVPMHTGHEFVGRVEKNLFRSAQLLYMALINDRNSVGHLLGLGQVMGDIHCGNPKFTLNPPELNPQVF